MTITVDSARDRASTAILKLEARFRDRLEVNQNLTRALVSFQANKAEPVFRWFKYREGFSRDLVEYCLDFAGVSEGQSVIDPFAGTGATLFTAANRGCDGLGIELMPVGINFMNFRQLISETGNSELFETLALLKRSSWKQAKLGTKYPYLKITEGAFPKATEQDLRRFRNWISNLSNNQQSILDFLTFSCLEEISYTRKDGQYLRWDYRAGKTRGSGKFDKGQILTFEDAINEKVSRIRADLTDVATPELFPSQSELRASKGLVTILQGTNFEHLEKLQPEQFDFAMTSPPYCNRYDYTRTYALELAHLGLDDAAVRDLRQSLLTCTVENRPKDFRGLEPTLVAEASRAFHESTTLERVLEFLDDEIANNRLNNKGIRTMVHGYFLESAIHIAQMARILKSGSRYVMVNDNVQYNGLPVPVDCILSELAEELGFKCEKIWVLPTGKGNSSQQMKRHGRIELRKCVFVWRRT